MKPLNFTLRQHTPMLHFQASQEGATLRASDVKPRFDRWLIKEVWKDNFDKCCSYLVGYSDKFSEKERNDFKKKFEGGFRALNYKMRIVSSKRIPMGIEVSSLDKVMLSGILQRLIQDQRKVIFWCCQILAGSLERMIYTILVYVILLRLKLGIAIKKL